MDGLRNLPSVDVLSRLPELQQFSPKLRVEAARRAIDEARHSIIEGSERTDLEGIAVRLAHAMTNPSFSRAINLSGVILHTGLGRARLAKAAVDYIAIVASNHVNLELDLDSGKRGDRQAHVRDLLTGLTGAEDAIVVQNAAAAVVLTLAALARGRDVILSRGQMVEIGGSFRMPDIVRESGCRLVEVGCTNKTRIDDYEKALTQETGCVLRCHTSNFQIVGFTEQPPLSSLVQVSHAYGVPCVDDMGTGCIVDTSRYGLPRIPTIQGSVSAGADVVIASGDKLLGGPQAGLILGKSSMIDSIKGHALARAFRIDKLSLAALEATLRLYDHGREAEVPTIGYLSRSLVSVEAMAKQISAALDGALLERGVTEVGGGCAPGITVPTWRVGIKASSPDQLAKKLRMNPTPLITRIEDDVLWMDPRTVDEDEVSLICKVLQSL